MKLALVAVIALGACVPRSSRVQTATERTASGPVCKEIVEEGKPARCSAVAPSALSGAR